MRLREGGSGRVDATGAGAPTEVPGDSEEELAACLADALVILGDMSILLVVVRLEHRPSPRHYDREESCEKMRRIDGEVKQWMRVMSSKVE